METAEPGSDCSGTRHFVVVGSSRAGCIRAFAIPVGFTPFEDADFFCDPEKTTTTLGEEKQTDKNRNVTLQERTRSVPFAQPKTLNEIFRDHVSDPTLTSSLSRGGVTTAGDSGKKIQGRSHFPRCRSLTLNLDHPLGAALCSYCRPGN